MKQDNFPKTQIKIIGLIILCVAAYFGFIFLKCLYNEIQGNRHMKHKEWQKAAECYTRCIQYSGGKCKYYKSRGLAHLQMSDIEKALTDYNTCLKKNPEDIEALSGKGYAYQKNREYQKAIDIFTEVLEKDPSNPRAYCDRGWGYKKVNDIPKAEKDFTMSIKLGNNANAYVEKTYIYIYYYNDLAKAGEIINTCLIKHPKCEYAYTTRGEISRRLKKYDDSIKDAERALRINPNLDFAYNVRGKAHFYKGEFEQALADLKKSLPSDIPAPLTNFYLGMTHKKLGNDKEALESYRKFLQQVWEIEKIPYVMDDTTPLQASEYVKNEIKKIEEKENSESGKQKK
jgi:tetratricopeptide (TPR) repeat protein